jgi:hypothetical protein
MNFKKIAMVFIISIIALANLQHYASACTVKETNTLSPFFGQQVFGNCSIDVSPSNGINIFSNTLKWNVNGGFFLLWIAIYASVAFMLLVQDRSFARYNAITFFGLVLALVMNMFGLVGVNTIIIAVSVFMLSIIASFFLHSNR